MDPLIITAAVTGGEYVSKATTPYVPSTTEEIVQEGGYLKTQSLGEYMVPTSLDVPSIESHIVEVPVSTGPYGAKGVGEPALIPTAPAVINAIADALGERIYSLPANLERVLEASIKAGYFGPKEDKNV